MGNSSLLELIKAYGLYVSLIVIGVFYALYGLQQIIGGQATVAQVEIIKNEEIGELVVDITGAVAKPGLYKVASGSRIGDLIALSGGLTESADTMWVEKNINLAEQVKDEMKVYIPEKVEENNQQVNVSNATQDKGKGHININLAEQTELDSLPGIGAVRAKQIIEARPYRTKEELMSKAGLSQKVYDEIKDLVTLY